jgi:hypothetical protein
MKFGHLLLFIGAVTLGVDASATEKAISSGAEKAASEDIQNLRRGGSSRSSTRRSYSGRTTTSTGRPSRYGSSFSRYGSYRGYYGYRPSMMDQLWREVDRNIIRPIDRATHKSR